MLFLSSCIESEEEVWINSDGTGRVRFQLTLPSMAKGQLKKLPEIIEKLKKVDQEDEEFEIQTISYTQSGRKLFLKFDASCTSLLDLNDIVDRHRHIFESGEDTGPSTVSQFIGDINLSLMSLTPSYERQILLSSFLPPSMKAAASLMGDDASFKYTIHLPSPPKEHNAHETLNQGNTLKWTFQLKKHLQDPMIMQVTTSLPIPWWIYAILFVIAALLLRILIKRLRR